MSISQKCRFCEHYLKETFIDLGESPLSNSYLTNEHLGKKETFYPLHAKICSNCFLVQLPQFEAPENIFGDYAYFSSYSDSWLKHSENYTNKMIERFHINSNWSVIEIASNDGYLLQYFKKAHIPVLGIEPAMNVATVAEEKGISTIPQFFGKKLAEKLRAEGTKANLLIANNVLAHVPDLNDFVAGLGTLLDTNGILTVEFPHLLRLIEHNQFDTIYHEHFSYFSLYTAQKVFDKHNLVIFDVEELPTHGGSLRLFVKHKEDNVNPMTPRVENLLLLETNYGLDKIETYKNFAEKIHKLKEALINLIAKIKKEGKTIVGYGAPAKGNTLLNYCGIDSKLIDFTVDKNPYKQNRYLPGIRIPIFSPDKIKEKKPDFIFVLPWNIKDEIIEQMSFIKNWNGKFIVPIPHLEIL